MKFILWTGHLVTLATAQTITGDKVFKGNVSYWVNNHYQFQVYDGFVQGGSSDKFYIDTGHTISATNPLYASLGDVNTGLGRFAEGCPSLISSGIETLRSEKIDTLAATETSLWLYDKDNGAMQQVTVGVADSGGAGFKVLRISN